MPQVTSTPAKRPRLDLRRKSVLNRLSTIPATPLRKQQTEVTLSLVDDNAERSKRQKELELERRLSNIQSATRTSEIQQRLSSLFADHEAKEHLQNCHKLFSENKITTKNVWALKIIDVLSQIVLQKKESNLLQIASTGLDVSAKVYGIRVDDVHSFGLRLASNLTKSDNKDRAGIETDRDEGDGRRNAVKKRKQKIVKLDGKKPTIDSEEQFLCTSLKQIEKPEFNVDDKLENGEIDNLFTLRLPIHQYGHTFRVFNNKKYKITETDITIENQSTIENNLENWDNKNICPSFDNFLVNQDAGFFDATLVENQLAFDDQGVPIPELDDSIHDPFTTDNDANMTDEDEEVIVNHQHHEQQLPQITEIIDSTPTEECIENEYNYNTLIKTSNGKVIEKLWAGPAHWKIKYLKRRSLRSSGNTVFNQQIVKCSDKKKKQKIIATPVTMTFASVNILRLDINNKYKDRKKSVLEYNNIKKNMLPQLSSIVFEFQQHFHDLLLKPYIATNQRATRNIEADAELYNYNNLDDTNFCPQNDNNNNNNDSDDSDHNNDEFIGNQNLTNGHNDENFENQLVDVPETVTVDYLTYALHAKKVNMKVLKKAVWDRLTENNQFDDNNTIEPLQFSKLYREIPERLNPTMAKELSVALVFNSVLYLTNENSLILKQEKSDQSDFIIMK